MNNLRRFNLETFETLFDQVFTTAVDQAETIEFVMHSLCGIDGISEIVNHFKQFQQRRQCIQRLATYHICNTCYHDGLCLCENCYFPEEHRNHDVRERVGSGYCDCGILKNGGYCNCRNHNPKVPVKENLLQIAFGDDLEYAKGLVRIVLKRISRFVRVVFAERMQTNFAFLISSARSLLQAEALYQLFGEVSSEVINGEEYSFFQSVYRELNTSRSFTDSFMKLFAYQWFVPLGMHPSNYKHYEIIIKPDYISNVKFISLSMLMTHEFQKKDV